VAFLRRPVAIRLAHGRTRAWRRGFAVLATLLFPGSDLGASNHVSEVELKSAFLYRFTHYAEWPDASTPRGPIEICVLGRDQLAVELEEAVRGRSVRDRPVTGRRLGSEEDATACHVLFVGWTDPGRIDGVLARTAELPILTVGDVQGFAHRGGMINFLSIGSRLGFEINRDAAERAGLHLSSQLLKLATLVE